MTCIGTALRWLITGQCISLRIQASESLMSSVRRCFIQCKLAVADPCMHSYRVSLLHVLMYPFLPGSMCSRRFYQHGSIGVLCKFKFIFTGDYACPLVNCNFCAARLLQCKHGAASFDSRVSNSALPKRRQPDDSFPVWGPRVCISGAAGPASPCSARGVFASNTCLTYHVWYAGPGRSRRRPWRICLCDQSSTDGDEGHLYRGSRKARGYLPQYWMHPFKGSRWLSALLCTATTISGLQVS